MKRLIFFIGLVVEVTSGSFSARADWCIHLSQGGAQHVMGTSTICGYATREQALAVLQSQFGGMGTVTGYDSANVTTPSGGYNPGQQLMYQGANAFGNAIGQAFGNLIRDALSSGPSEQELEAQRRQQEEEARRQAAIAEQQRLARIAMASKMRGFWDGEDQAVSSNLSGVFDLPASHSTPFYGLGGGNADSEFLDSSVVDLRGTSAADGSGIVPIGLGTSGLPTEGAGIAPGAPIAPPTAPAPAPKTYTRAQIDAQIRQVQNQLRKLSQSIARDQSERDYWESMSADATHDAWQQLWKVGSESALSVLQWNKQRQIGEKIDEVINVNAQRLPLYMNPSEGELLVLEGDKAKLETIDLADKVTDATYDSSNVRVTDGAKRRESGLNATLNGVEIVDSLETFGRLPGPPGLLGVSRKVLDATYLDAVQLTSVSRIEALNGNPQQMRAINSLKAQLEALEREKSAPRQ